jgi:hypothetical protein
MISATGEMPLTTVAEAIGKTIDATRRWLSYHGIHHIRHTRRYSANAVALAVCWQSAPAAVVYQGDLYSETISAAAKRTGMTGDIIRGAVDRGVVRAIRMRDWPVLIVTADVDKYKEAHN